MNWVSCEKEISICSALHTAYQRRRRLLPELGSFQRFNERQLLGPSASLDADGRALGSLQDDQAVRDGLMLIDFGVNLHPCLCFKY